MTASSMFVLCGTVLAVTVYGVAEYQSRQNVVTVGFWVDQSVTFDVPYLAKRGGPLSGAERERVIEVARREIATAFDGLRVRVSDSPNAFYRVRVEQLLTWHRVAVSGQSHVFGLLGGAGAVSFETLASQAVARGPDAADRGTIVEAIGRGLGRAAVHEFAHMMLPQVPLHASTDESSYEFWNSDRVAQFYGPMRWDLAGDHLRRRFGREPAAAARDRQSEDTDDDRTARTR